MASTKPPRNSITTGSAIEDIILEGAISLPNSGLQNTPIPLVDTVRRRMVITSRDVVQLGIISNIHISAANTNRAMTLCCTTVRAAIPNHETGIAQRKIVTISTMGRSTQYFTLNFLSDI